MTSEHAIKAIFSEIKAREDGKKSYILVSINDNHYLRRILILSSKIIFLNSSKKDASVVMVHTLSIGNNISSGKAYKKHQEKISNGRKAQERKLN